MSEHDAEREPGPGNLVGRSIEEFVSQLRAFSDRARGLAAGAVPSAMALPRLPSPPGALSAAQLRAIDKSVKGQRQQIQALVGQLQAFDEQLAVFERILGPLVEWSASWAKLEESISDLVRPGHPPPTPPPSSPPTPPRPTS